MSLIALVLPSARDCYNDQRLQECYAVNGTIVEIVLDTPRARTRRKHGQIAASGRDRGNNVPMNDKDVIMVHSSDLHVDHDYTARLHGGDGTAGLTCVLNAARAIGAD